MKIKISTKVDSTIENVWQKFDANLFLKLAPPFPPIKLLRFDGCKKSDIVELELNFFGFKQRWDALIIEHKITENEIYFIDEAIKVPFFLKSWKHLHKIEKTENGAVIIDDINYESINSFFTILLFPILYLQFLYRKPIYKSYFKSSI